MDFFLLISIVSESWNRQSSWGGRIGVVSFYLLVWMLLFGSLVGLVGDPMTITDYPCFLQGQDTWQYVLTTWYVRSMLLYFFFFILILSHAKGIGGATTSTATVLAISCVGGGYVNMRFRRALEEVDHPALIDACWTERGFDQETIVLTAWSAACAVLLWTDTCLATNFTSLQVRLSGESEYGTIMS